MSHYPALAVEFGAVFVLIAALLARVLSRWLDIPSIVTLLACGLLAGPGGLNALHINLTDPPTRALLTLAVVVVLFEVTLRVDLRRMPKLTIGLLAFFGTGLTLAVLPAIARTAGLDVRVAAMVGAICVVTGPTVIGPLVARLRPRSEVGHVLETEGLVLDALGVVIAAMTFAIFTSRVSGPFSAGLLGIMHVGVGVIVGIACAIAGRIGLRFMERAPSDLTKVFVLLLAFATYATSELLSHESGLVAVVVGGLLLDARSTSHERLLRSFKEDLSMLALSTVFVLLASQIRIADLVPLLRPAAVIVAGLIAIRIIAVSLGTARSPMTWRERVLMASVFPRGIVAISLATYYATQMAAWSMRGGHQLAAAIFLVVILTIVLSTTASITVSRLFRLQMPSLLIAGISPATLDCARRFRDRGHLPFMADTDELSVAFARSSNSDAECIGEPRDLARLAHQHKAAFVIVDSFERWAPYLSHLGDLPVLSVGSEDERRVLEGFRLGEPESGPVARSG